MTPEAQTRHLEAEARAHRLLVYNLTTPRSILRTRTSALRQTNPKPQHTKNTHRCLTSIVTPWLTKPFKICAPSAWYSPRHPSALTAAAQTSVIDVVCAPGPPLPRERAACTRTFASRSGYRIETASALAEAPLRKALRAEGRAAAVPVCGDRRGTRKKKKKVNSVAQIQSV